MIAVVESISTLPVPLGASVMFPSVTLTIELPFTSKGPPSCGVVSLRTSAATVKPSRVIVPLRWSTLNLSPTLNSPFSSVDDCQTFPRL